MRLWVIIPGLSTECGSLAIPGAFKTNLAKQVRP